MSVTQQEYDELFQIDSLPDWHSEPCICGTYECVGWVMVCDNPCVQRFHVPLITIDYMTLKYKRWQHKTANERVLRYFLAQELQKAPPGALGIVDGEYVFEPMTESERAELSRDPE